MAQPALLTPVPIVGSVIMMVRLAIRANFRGFQIPIAGEFSLLRAEFSRAIATAAGSAGQVFGTPLMSGFIAPLQGLRYMGTLYGIVFLSHQLGAFLGVWLGGRLHDVTGGDVTVCRIGIAVGAEPDHPAFGATLQPRNRPVPHLTQKRQPRQPYEDDKARPDHPQADTI